MLTKATRAQRDDDAHPRRLREHQPAKIRVRHEKHGDDRRVDELRAAAAARVQVQRLANPLVNEASSARSTRTCGTRSSPRRGAVRRTTTSNPRLALALSSRSSACRRRRPTASTSRTCCSSTTRATRRLSELLRLNLTVAADAAAQPAADGPAGHAARPRRLAERPPAEGRRDRHRDPRRRRHRTTSGARAGRRHQRQRQAALPASVPVPRHAGGRPEPRSTETRNGEPRMPDPDAQASRRGSGGGARGRHRLPPRRRSARTPPRAGPGGAVRRSPRRFQAGVAGDTPSAVRRSSRRFGTRRTMRGRSRCSGLAYQQRARETADAAYYTKAEGVLRRALAARAGRHARDERARLAGARASPVRRRARPRPAGPSGRRPYTARNYGLRRRRAARARPLRRGVRDLRPDGRAEAEPRRLRAHRLRPRAARPPRAARSRRWSSRSTPRGNARADRVDARRARQAPLLARRARAGRAAVPRRARRLSRLRHGARRPRAGRGRARSTRRARSRSRGRRPTPSRCRSSSARSATCSPRAGETARGARAVRARRRDRAPAGRERRQLRPRDSRSSASTTASGCARRSRSRAPRAPTRPSIYGDDVLAWALARNGRCGEALALLEALAPARHEGRDALYFHRGMIERCLGHRRGRAALVRARASTEPALLAPLGADRAEARVMKRLLVLARRARRARGAGRRRSRTRSATSRSTATRRSSSPAGGSTSTTRSTWPRSRRCSSATGPRGRLRRARRPRNLELPSTAGARRCACSSAASSSGPARPASRRSASTPSTRPRATGTRLAFRDRNFGSRIGWREVVVHAERRRRAARRERPGRERERRAPRVPERPAPLAARRLLGDRVVRARRRAGHAAARSTAPQAAEHRGGGFESLDLARRPLARRDPALARDRGVLGRSARAHARARQGDRRRLPRRHEGPPARRGPARRDRHRHAHDRRLRARLRDAPALAVHRPRDALSRG